MCRIALVINAENNQVIQLMSGLQTNGSNIKPEFKSIDNNWFVTNRFGVTSQNQEQGEYPLESEKYLFAYNGEVYSFKDEVFDPTDDSSDVHFALGKIEQHGLDAFFKEADIQGTFFIYDKEKKISHIFNDQLNTSGCFYAQNGKQVIVAQEYSIVHRALSESGAPGDTPIHVLKNGSHMQISQEGEIAVSTYRNQYNELWSGRVDGVDELTRSVIDGFIDNFNDTLTQAVHNRIPKEGTVGILCSGGVDSSIIFHLTYTYLKERGQLDRLKVFTLGSDNNTELEDKDNDLANVRQLLRAYGLPENETLVKIEDNKKWKEYLYRNAVFNDHPSLIPANPASVQVRNTVQMSSVLASAIDKCPDLKTMLTGDFADEIFVGYPLLHRGGGEYSGTRL